MSAHETLIASLGRPKRMDKISYWKEREAEHSTHEIEIVANAIGSAPMHPKEEVEVPRIHAWARLWSGMPPRIAVEKRGTVFVLTNKIAEPESSMHAGTSATSALVKMAFIFVRWGGLSLLDNPPQLARLVVGELPGTSEELRVCQASVWIVIAWETLCQKLRRLCGLVISHRVARARQSDDKCCRPALRRADQSRQSSRFRSDPPLVRAREASSCVVD